MTKQQKEKIIELCDDMNRPDAAKAFIEADRSDEEADLASHLREELENLRYWKQRYADFWEWFEMEYDESEDEVWKKFEAWEDLAKSENIEGIF